MAANNEKCMMYRETTVTTTTTTTTTDDWLKEEKCVIQNKSNFKRTVRSITYYSRVKWMNVAQCSNQSSAMLLLLLLRFFLLRHFLSFHLFLRWFFSRIFVFFLSSQLFKAKEEITRRIHIYISLLFIQLCFLWLVHFLLWIFGVLKSHGNICVHAIWIFFLSLL